MLAVAIPVNGACAANVADFADYSLRNDRNSVLLPGRLYIPPEASIDPDMSRPLVLFLHGAGEQGTNNISQINVNIDNLLAEAKRRGAFLYAPQSTSNWNSLSLTDNVMTMIDRAETEFNVDRRRLYVTGLSNGGGGTWNMLNRFPGEFAAAVPISGVRPASDFVASRIVSESIWAFHARNDTVVSVATSHNTINSVLSAAQQPLPTYPPADFTRDFFMSNPSLASHRTLEQIIEPQPNVSAFHRSGDQLDLLYYEFSVGGHGIWPTVYSEPPVYDWLFSHALVPEPTTLAIAATFLGISLLGRRQRRC